MSTALDKPLWNRIKNKIQRGSIGGKADTWNARKAQLAVKEYKKAGGKYPKKKDPNNSLAKWTREDWGYIDGKPGNRYLPKSVRDKLSPAEKKEENKRKKNATKKKLVKAKYSPSVLAKMQKK